MSNESDTVLLKCKCGASARISRKTLHESVGKRLVCPLCGMSVEIRRKESTPAQSNRVPSETPQTAPNAAVAATNPRLAECPDCGNAVSRRATQCPNCGCPFEADEAEVSVKTPEFVDYDPNTNLFTGTVILIVKLAMRAINDLGWKLDQVNETLGIVTFETGISWGSWSGVSCTLTIEEVAPNAYRVTGTGKQNVRGGQLFAPNIGGEAQSKARKAIETMKCLARR